MVELEDINGIGPARSESLQDAGYESVEALAEADSDDVAEDADMTGDTALELVVKAQDAISAASEEDEGETSDETEEFDLTPSDLSDEAEEVEEEEDEEVEEKEDDEPAEDESESTDEDESVETYEITLDFANKQQYDVFHAALMRRHERVYTSSQPSADALQKFLDGLDNFEEVTYSDLTEAEVNELHSSIRQRRSGYQGSNLIEHMDALREVEDQLNEQRDELLFG